MEKRLDSLEEAWELTNVWLDQIQQALERLSLQLAPANHEDQLNLHNSGGEVSNNGRIGPRFARLIFCILTGMNHWSFCINASVVSNAIELLDMKRP